MRKVSGAVSLIGPLICLLVAGGCHDSRESRDQVVVFETSMGTFEVTLEPRGARQAVNNFTCLVQQGFYDSLLVYRVIRGFVIQAGVPTGICTGGRTCTGAGLPDEPNSYVSFADPLTLGMARNAAPNSASSQFF